MVNEGVAGLSRDPSQGHRHLPLRAGRFGMWCDIRTSPWSCQVASRPDCEEGHIRPSWRGDPGDPTLAFFLLIPPCSLQRGLNPGHLGHPWPTQWKDLSSSPARAIPLPARWRYAWVTMRPKLVRHWQCPWLLNAILTSRWSTEAANVLVWGSQSSQLSEDGIRCAERKFESQCDGSESWLTIPTAKRRR